MCRPDPPECQVCAVTQEIWLEELYGHNEAQCGKNREPDKRSVEPDLSCIVSFYEFFCKVMVFLISFLPLLVRCFSIFVTYQYNLPQISKSTSIKIMSLQTIFFYKSHSFKQDYLNNIAFQKMLFKTVVRIQTVL